MRIQDAKQAYSAQLNVLQVRRQALRKFLQEQEKNGAANQNFDRVELSKELSVLDAQYEAVRSGMEGIMARETMIHDAEEARQQGEAAAKAYAEIGKMMEVYRRIASGAKVPAKDEQKLMEFSHELYMAAKTMALMREKNDKEYDSLWKDKDDSSEDKRSPDEIAGETEISVSSPERVAAAAAEAPPALDVQI